MELKRYNYRCSFNFFPLLIVPYGIETRNSRERMKVNYLLIVPYGIETLPYFVVYGRNGLLIVPYGIETWFKAKKAKKSFAFNRTLWN